MKIRLIEENDWKSIVEIQRLAYIDIEPESEAVLRRKHVISPGTCTVAVDNYGNVTGCCLAHPWDCTDIPPLHEEINQPAAPTDNLFIHDLAVFPDSRRKGVAGSLATGVITLAKTRGFRSMTLVSVQNSENFWKKFGFLRDVEIKPPESYGKGAIFMKLGLSV